MPAIQGALLLYTDFTSAELYAFSPAVLQRYFDQVVLGFPMSGEVAIQLILPVLRELALSRRLNSALGLGTAPVDPTGDCEIAGAKIVFDLERFTLRFLNKAASTHRIEEYRAGHARLGAVLNADHRLWVHGEDMLDILHWVVVRLRGGARTVARPLLGKTLLLATPLGELAAQPLFLELCGRLS